MLHTAEYIKIDKRLREANHATTSYNMESILSWCAARVDWAWKWKKITATEKDELCDRIIHQNKGE